MIEQGTDLWKQQRLGMVTASRFSDCWNPTSKTADRYLADLLAELLTGEPSDDFESKETRHGKAHEDAAIESYERLCGFKTRKTGLIYLPGEPFIAGSPDRLVGDDGLVEVKCPYRSAIHLLTVMRGRMPDEHKAQVQGNLWITGRKWADFVSYDPRVVEECRLFVVRVPRDDVYIAELSEVVKLFRDRLVQQIQVLSKERSHG